MNADAQPVLALRDLTVDFTVGDRVVHAVRGVNLEVRRGEVVAVVGESGSGKSTVMLAVMGLLAANATVRGQALLDGTDLLGIEPAALRDIRGRRVAMIFQDPMTSLNPVVTVGRQLAEAILVHRPMSKSAATARARELLELVAIPHAEERLRNYPHELSGGMRQRVMIAMAMANDPDVLIADEPTTALDVTIQAQILEVLDRLRRERNLAIVLVTHDLGVVAGVADSVHVMYAGNLVEEGDVRNIFYHPAHPYTRGLLACSPRLDHDSDDLVPIPGSPPVLTDLPAGCAFAPRCSLVTERCHTEVPVLRDLGTTRAACIVAAPDSPQAVTP
jgi:peptide/nickel transport system ATP-binding protein